MEKSGGGGAGTPVALLKATGMRLADILLPPRCAACNHQTALSGAVCAKCWREIDFIERPFCARLGLPFPFVVGEDQAGDEIDDYTLSAEAIAHPPVFDRARAVAVYDGPARHLVTALKFGDRTDLAPVMARWMARAGAELLADADLIVPVPLHNRRLRQRKHNQSALLVNALARVTGKNAVPDLLRRTRSTRAQVGLNARQRTANVRGAFAVAPKYAARLDGARVLLVDDVITTGATINASTRALMGCGAGAVDVLSFARVVAPAQIPI